jgi:hypothetical protein
MNKVQWWKNFDLNAEIHIAGTFLYDGVQSLGHFRTLNHDDEVFSVLYHLSVGFERLMKVIVVLAEHGDQTDQVAFEKKLVTHNTEALLQRIEKVRPLKISRAERALVRCLTEFYGTFRYDHFRLETIRGRGRLRDSFKSFLEKDSGMKISKPDEFVPSDDMGVIHRHVDKVVRGLATKLYDVVDDLARENGIFTYELRFGSKPSLVFQGEEHTFQKEEIAMKELLLFFLKRSADTKLTIVTNNLEPLDFDPPEAVECADAFFRPDQRQMLMDMVDALRADREDIKDRDQLLELLGSAANNTYTDEEMREMGATEEDLREHSED